MAPNHIDGSRWGHSFLLAQPHRSVESLNVPFFRWLFEIPPLEPPFPGEGPVLFPDFFFSPMVVGVLSQIFGSIKAKLEILK